MCRSKFEQPTAINLPGHHIYTKVITVNQKPSFLPFPTASFPVFSCEVGRSDDGASPPKPSSN